MYLQAQLKRFIFAFRIYCKYKNWHYIFKTLFNGFGLES